MHCFCIKTMPLYSQEKVSSGTSRYYYIQNSSYRDIEEKRRFFVSSYYDFFFKCVKCDTFILSYKALKNYTITH